MDLPAMSYEVEAIADCDQYIIDVMQSLTKLTTPEGRIRAMNAMLLICYMALDHTAASPKLCETLDSIRRDILEEIKP